VSSAGKRGFHKRHQRGVRGGEGHVGWPGGGYTRAADEKRRERGDAEREITEDASTNPLVWPTRGRCGVRDYDR